MYAGGLLATLLVLGILLIVIVLAVAISEPRNIESPRPREDPADITRRLRPQGTGGRKQAGSGTEAKHSAG